MERNMSRRRNLAIAAAAGALAAVPTLADLDGSYVLPLDNPAIEYAKRPVNDPVSRFQARLDSGAVKLEYHPDLGYLPSLLRNLEVPASSQVLVFSKTSFQAARIYPRAPRALYFNDSMTVGYVRGGDVLELTAHDPQQGIIFYTLDQEPSAAPRLTRRDDCLQCHASGSTLGVPGLLVRSVHVDRMGSPLTALGGFITDHRSPLKERWGGWYVSGTHGQQSHMGNAIYEKLRSDALPTDNVTDLSRHLNTDAYLTPHSDIVALMVLEHQTRMQNLITRVGFETRMALTSNAAMNQLLKQPESEFSDSTKRRINNPAEEMLAYMLYADEAPLTGKIEGSSRYAQEFAARGPRDRRGRSLRQFDLTRRMFQYPLSFLIYSEAFDGLPDVARERVYRRLWEVLTGQDTGPRFAHLSKQDRQAILEILRETKPDLPEYWSAR
jgi:hypothetical protein